MNQVAFLMSLCELDLESSSLYLLIAKREGEKGVILCLIHPLFQDNYFEEAFKMRNVLEEFLKPRLGQRKPTILGLREHIFTGRSAF